MERVELSEERIRECIIRNLFNFIGNFIATIESESDT